MKNGTDPIEVFLFDWGDTLMADFPGSSGKMCAWEVVEAVDGAREALKFLSKQAEIYVATGATESTETEIESALARVDLARFVTGYFCKANLGVSKGSPGFLTAIIKKLGKPVSRIAMVGDSLEYDIKPAVDAGIKPIWLSGVSYPDLPESIRIIEHLHELCN